MNNQWRDDISYNREEKQNSQVVDFVKPVDRLQALSRGKRTRSVVVKMEGSSKMDDLLKVYIDKMDRDQSDLRKDIRESEKRTVKQIEDSETRMDKRLENIERLIEKQSEKIETNTSKVQEAFDSNKKFMWGIIITIIISIVGSVGVIIATYVSTISLLQNML